MFKPRDLAANLGLTVASLLAVFIAIELFIRTALFVDGFPDFGLRQPWRYADGDLDADHWKLAAIFGTRGKNAGVGHVDPRLGWSVRATETNPLGIHADAAYELDEIVDPIPFYGDSFVAGADNIPHLLDQLLPKHSVLNFGVGGYGVDQIYLRFLDTAERFTGQTVLIGILTYDLDRSILSFRVHQKPYFEIESGELVLMNTPVLSTAAEYIARKPVEIRSYFYRFVLFRMRDFLETETFDRFAGYNGLNKKKKELNAAILDAFRQEAADLAIDLRFVIFYAGEEIDHPTWRGEFLQDQLERLGFRYFDTREFLISQLQSTGLSVADLYEDDFGHLNMRGKEFVALALASWLDDSD